MSQQRKILLTGPSSGIGKAIAENLLRAGHQVLGLSRRAPGCFEHPAYQGFSADLSQLAPLPDLLKKICKQHPDIDALILNAGQGRFAKLEEFSMPQIRAMIDLNLTSPLIIARFLLPLLKRAPIANLIVMGSEAALNGGARGAVYAASKFGLRGAVQSLRQECAASPVRVTLINPGMVESPFFDNLGFHPDAAEDCHLSPQDVAQAVALALNNRYGAVTDEINLSPQKKVIRNR
ncbi:MAG: SDR family oxidoreductase [gamma proteobacterium symbiont of Bathyaustriella thionipta]|nr:SDR family oxidoreductase [gamma proteobacterium symbiont of Bathyaustriella thionipta]